MPDETPELFAARPVVLRGDFKLDMHVVVDRGDEEVDHFVDGLAYIYLAEDPQDERLWTIWKIEDRGTEHLKAVGNNSWSEIKALYRSYRRVWE